MYRVVSATAHSDCLEVDRNKFLSCVRRLAASLVFSIRAARASVRLSRGILAYFYYHYASHDETPLSANTRSHGVAGAVSSCTGSGIVTEVAVPSETSQLELGDFWEMTSA